MKSKQHGAPRSLAVAFGIGVIALKAACSSGPEEATSDASTGSASSTGDPSSTGNTSSTGTTGSASTTGSSSSGTGGGPICPSDSMTGPFESIPSNFDVDSELVPAWGTGDIPVSAAPDVVGAFRFICNASHLSYDDPIVFPGQPGKAHLHQFFGNTEANACSTYESLRTTGMSTCNNPLNRSAYWMPAMMNGKGKVVVPDYVSVYYKRRPKTDPACTTQATACVPIPRGLRFVFGYNPAQPDVTAGAGHFNCEGDTATPGTYPDIPTAAANCPTGNRLGAVIGAPNCWNGVDLDSPDHRSHLAGMSYGNTGMPTCPDTHPYLIPTFTLGAWYTVDDDLDKSGTWDPSISTWYLSSDMNADHSLKTPGSTFHTDWMGAWDDEVMQMWTDHCIDELLNCSGGDLGNGLQLKIYDGFSWEADPRVVDPPPQP
jgi:hypothetical protein